jgi:Dyp-type peroxidase family
LGEYSRTQALVDVESLSPDFAEAAVAEDPPPPVGFRYAPHPATKNPAFESGMAFRSVPVLNDPWTGSGSWEEWKVRSTRRSPLHGVIIIAFSKETTLEREVDKLKRALTSVTCVAVEEGQRMGEDGDRNEPFGFRDGVATPGVAATLASRGRHGSRFLPDGATSVFPPSELLVLAAGSEGARTNAVPAWAHHGSFLVYRRLNQDVARFREATKALALEQSKTQEEVEAMLMGRWKDGAPYEDAHGPTQPIAGERDAFDYSLGRCPIFAHTRKVNPRLSDEEARPLFRRGVAFGPVGDDVHDATPRERGIHFMCYQSSIERQFETVSRWMNHPHIPAAHAGFDAMLGRPTSDPGPATRRVGTFELTEFVFASGGEYFFAPSISGLRAICSTSRDDRSFRQENLR